MSLALLFVTYVLTLLWSTKAEYYTRCELAQALLQDGMPMNNLPDWVCLVEAESGRNSSAVGGPNKNGSFDFGLFQINSRWWCGIGEPAGDCHIDCYKLIDDDITDDVKCAKLIYSKRNFEAWNGWKAKCQNQTLPDIHDCFTKQSDTTVEI